MIKVNLVNRLCYEKSKNSAKGPIDKVVVKKFPISKSSTKIILNIMKGVLNYERS
jgi:hypothetical protein